MSIAPLSGLDINSLLALTVNKTPQTPPKDTGGILQKTDYIDKGALLDAINKLAQNITDKGDYDPYDILNIINQIETAAPFLDQNTKNLLDNLSSAMKGEITGTQPHQDYKTILSGLDQIKYGVDKHVPSKQDTLNLARLLYDWGHDTQKHWSADDQKQLLGFLQENLNPYFGYFDDKTVSKYTEFENSLKNGESDDDNIRGYLSGMANALANLAKSAPQSRSPLAENRQLATRFVAGKL